MPDLLWISGGRVIDPASGRDAVGEVFAREGRFVPDLTASERRQARRVDATGLVVAPGLVDIHVHLREPGQTHKESIASGTRAAAAGGFTTVVCMPNTTPPADNVGTVRQILDAIRRDAVVHCHPTGCITKEMKGEQLAPIGSLRQAGVVAITDDGACVQNNELMRRAVEYAHMFRLPVMDHCQDRAMTEGAVMNEGHWSLRLGLTGWPNAAEDIIVARNIILAEMTGGHIHLQHLSSARSVAFLRRARQRQVPVSGEATPHHLALTEEELRTYDTNFKMNPPLRTAEDRQALLEGLLDGTIDCLATDHAPHTNYEKDKEFDLAPFGIIGLETALAVTLGALVEPGHASLGQFLGWWTHRPARLLGLPRGEIAPGRDADLVLFDPSETWTADPTRWQSRSSNSPWNGRRLRGRVRSTFVQGRLVWDGQSIVATP